MFLQKLPCKSAFWPSSAGHDDLASKLVSILYGIGWLLVLDPIIKWIDYCLFDALVFRHGMYLHWSTHINQHCSCIHHCTGVLWRDKAIPNLIHHLSHTFHHLS